MRSIATKLAIVALVAAGASMLTGSLTRINLATQAMGVLAMVNGGTGAAYPSLTELQTQITGNVTLGTSSYTASSGTFPAVTTSAAGTWLVTASLSLQTTSTTSAVNFTCELYDGTNVIAQGYIVIGAVSSAAVRDEQMALTGIKAEAGTVTFTARCTSTTASQLMEAAAANNSGGNFSSTINAVRIQ